MLITEKDKRIPSPDDVTMSLDALFAHLTKAPRKMARPFVIATDPDFPDSVCADGWYPREEFVELRRCTHLFKAALNVYGRRNKRDDPLRLMLFHYLHIIEADYPAALVLNALRFVWKPEPQPPAWKFLNTSDPAQPTCEHPDQKFQQLEVLAKAHDSSLARVLSMLYKSRLRNAIAHSHFRVQHGGRLLFLTKDYSPISRKIRKSKIKGTTCPTYTFEAVEKLWQCAVRYWECADRLYRHFEI